MRYYVVNDTAEIDRFKKYYVIDADTLYRKQYCGGSIIRYMRDQLVNESVFKDFDYCSDTLRVRVSDKVLYVYHRGMTYIVSGVDVRYIYQENKIIHVGVSDLEIKIDTVNDNILNVGSYKYVEYKGNMISKSLPESVRVALGLSVA